MYKFENVEMWKLAFGGRDSFDQLIRGIIVEPGVGMHICSRISTFSYFPISTFSYFPISTFPHFPISTLSGIKQIEKTNTKHAI